MNSDFRDLLCALAEEKADYLIIGGYAVMRYTEPRYTKDFDILIGTDGKNAERVFRALARFGAPMQGLAVEDFTNPETFFQIGVAPNRIDVITTVPGVSFGDATKRAEQCMIDGVPYRFIDLADLIQSKLAAGRPQDLVDAGALTKAKLAKG